jgi:hypothetical protein
MDRVMNPDPFLPEKATYPVGMALSSILLKGGTVLFHEKDDHVSP